MKLRNNISNHSLCHFKKHTNITARMIEVQKIFHEKSDQRCYSLQHKSYPEYTTIHCVGMTIYENCFWVFIDFDEAYLK